MKDETLEQKCPSRGFCLFEGNHGWSPPEPQADASLKPGLAHGTQYTQPNPSLSHSAPQSSCSAKPLQFQAYVNKIPSPGLKMDMSSYQFVNTLAQCYEANAQLQGAGAAAAGSVGAATAPQDYYNMQYPNCYSPATQQGYAQQYSSMMGAAASHDYTPPSSSATLSSSQASARRSPGLPSAPSAPSLTPAPLTQSNLAANCKYTDSNVGSPQDLSTTSSGGTPQPGAGPKSPDSDIEDNGPQSPMSPSPGAGASSSAFDIEAIR